MSNFNFEPQDLSLSISYDGFIDQLGNFYIVKERGKEDLSDSFNSWALKYMNEKCRKITMVQSYPMLLELSNLSSSLDFLVHCYGFIYYSHDLVFDLPIVLLPNFNIAGKRASSDQMECLCRIMLINNEQPQNKEFIVDSSIFEYNGLIEEEGGKIK